MGFDVLLLALLLAFTALGAWRGAVESGLRLVGWIGGYGVAVYAGAVFGDDLAARAAIPGWAGIPLAGTAAFLVVQALFSIAIAIARRRRRGGDVGSGDRALGALFGAARGALVVALIGWAGLVLGALQSQGALAGLPGTENSMAARWSGAVVERGAGAVLGREDAGARVATAIAARPRETLDALRGVIEHPRVAALQNDAAFWARVDQGDLDGALELPSARALVGDAGLRGELAQLGLVTPQDAATPESFERALRAALDGAVERLAQLRNDPEMRALLQDPEVLGLVERRDALGLLSHPRFRSVLRRAST
ncbi:MAG TPA: CvpA family protein [Myxococcota bacterium]|nr:CvpA family protein [Myxococcota bacterium]